MKAKQVFSLALLVLGASAALNTAQAQQELNFLASVAAAPVERAPQEDIGRAEIQRHDAVVPGYETLQVRVDLPRDASFPRHSHPGDEAAFVLTGTIEYQLDGKPPVTLHAGEGIFLPAGTVHAAKNVGNAKASELATYLVRKGQPVVHLAD
ncbi:MAG: cupin domain-containing protein [Burkholderiaceae bacterium]|nr:cupin domain-containing protein [Roseateles sp.]MBV8468463.1 cupin domain-containing protein [Burkholderiaceae bacterium]